MTAQVPETLRFKGEELDMCCEPLASYLRVTRKVLNYTMTSSACWRGYQGTWEIVNDQLYLVEISAEIQTTVGARSVTLQDYFTRASGPVFAHWFTGEIRCTRGAILEYVHGGYGSTYEEDLFLEIKAGMLIGERLVINGKDDKGLPTGAVLAGYVRLNNTNT
jgi:hypothetical protein